MVSAKITDSGLFHAFVIRIANKGCYVDSTTHQWQLTRHRWVRWNQSETFFCLESRKCWGLWDPEPLGRGRKTASKMRLPTCLIVPISVILRQTTRHERNIIWPLPLASRLPNVFYRINLPFERRVGSHKFCWGWGPPLWMGTWWPLENVSSPTVSSCQFRSF